jgi:hypothetical protein
MTPKALDKESVVMQHCIGGGAYDDNLLSGDFEYWSLRDKFGKAHATIEIRYADGDRDEKIVCQLQGKQNRPPNDRYFELVGPYFKQMGIEPFQLGLKIYDVDFKIHDVQDLPEGVTTGPLRLESMSHLVLPRSMTVNGDLYIQNCKKIQIPQELKVKSDLVITNTTLEYPAEAIEAERLILCGNGVGGSKLTGTLSTNAILARGVIILFWGHETEEFTPNISSKAKRNICLGVDRLYSINGEIEIDKEIEFTGPVIMPSSSQTDFGSTPKV